jgi:hypothetical protein
MYRKLTSEKEKLENDLQKEKEKVFSAEKNKEYFKEVNKSLKCRVENLQGL